MLYFSEIFGNNVFDSQKNTIGTVRDFLFLPLETGLITKLVVKTHTEDLLVPIKQVHKNGNGFVLSANSNSVQKNENEMSLLFTLQNQQIVDVRGEQVIRVNDVIISDTPEYAVSGIDVGVLAVFRWIGIAKFISDLLLPFGIHYKSHFIPWNDLQPKEIIKGRIVLKKEQEKVKKLLPEDLAEHLENATIQNVLKALKVMDKDTSARVIADLSLDYQKEVLRRYSAERAAQILSFLDPAEGVDALLAIDKVKRKEILRYVEPAKQKKIEHLIQLSKTPIGHLLTSNYLALPSDSLIKQVIEAIHSGPEDFSELLYVYFVNKENQIVGVLSLYELLLQKPETPAYKVMNQNLILGRLTTPIEIVLHRILKYKLYAMPIVDEDRHILGVVSLQDIDIKTK